jgi:hypothetical protein
MYYRFQNDPEMELNGVRPAVIAEQPDLDLSWHTGRRFRATFKEPIRCTLSERSGPDMLDVFLSKMIPLMSSRLVDALLKAGVDNLDTFAAEIIDPATGRAVGDHKAVNIVGKAECVNLAKSEYDPRSDFPMLEFEKIVLNESKIRGLKMFRLAENPSFILIDESVKKALETSTWVGLAIHSLDDPMAY